MMMSKVSIRVLMLELIRLNPLFSEDLDISTVPFYFPESGVWSGFAVLYKSDAKKTVTMCWGDSVQCFGAFAAYFT